MIPQSPSTSPAPTTGHPHPPPPTDAAQATDKSTHDLKIKVPGQKPAGKDTAESPINIGPTQLIQSPYFPLLSVPQEFVDIIFIEMLHANNFTILDTSSAIRARVFPLIERNCVYRITIGRQKGVQIPLIGGFELGRSMTICVIAPRLDDEIARRIQNIELKLTSDEYPVPHRSSSGQDDHHDKKPQRNDHGLDILTQFSGTNFERDSCPVIISCTDGDYHDLIINKLNPFLKPFMGYRNLIFVYDQESPHNSGPSTPHHVKTEEIFRL